MADKAFHEFAYAPMCTHQGASWFALSFVGHARREVQVAFIKAMAGDGHGWRVLEAQGWRIVRVKVSEVER
jgi:hypothetical protein